MKSLTCKIGTHEISSHYVFLEKTFEKICKPGFMVFDAGCGDGRFLANLPTDIYGVGLDIEKENIQKAKKKRKMLQNLFFVVGDLHYLPFKKTTFHIIFCRDVLEHIKSGEKAINEFTLLLAKNGIILISTTNLISPAMLVDILLPNNISAIINKKLGGPEYYERNYRFSPWTLIKKLRKNELDVKLMMLGCPLIGKAWIYYNKNVKLPKIYYFWIVFDKITDFNLFKKFKELIIVIARK